jgi:ATP:ADP antiporter, AAA family
VERDRSVGQRLLAPIADVRQDEVAGVLLMASLMLLLLGAYYMLKTAREALILTYGGAEVKTYSSAGQAALLLILIPAFSALASRVDRTKLVSSVTMFFIVNLLAFALFGRASRTIGITYFIWVGIFNVMVIAQFWGFANDLLTPDQGKRLFPVIGLGSNLGAWLGSSVAGRMIAAIGPFPLMFVAGGILGGCVVIAIVVSQRHKPRASPGTSAEATKPLGREGAFALIRADRYLLYIMFLAVLVNVVTTSTDYQFGRLLVERATAMFGSDAASAADRERFLGATYGRLYSYINLTGFLTQLLLVSRIFKFIGIGNALFIHPLISLVGNMLMLGGPSIRVMGWFKVADASTDYSLDNTARQALWLPTSREAKYKAKQAVDSFFVRVGDMLQAGIVYTGSALAFSVQAFAGVSLALTAAWLVVVFRLRQMYSERVEEPAVRVRSARTA